jgi:hypothetical protein
MRAIESNETPDRANSTCGGGERAGARRDDALILPEFIQAHSRSNAPMTPNRAKPLHQQLQLWIQRPWTPGFEERGRVLQEFFEFSSPPKPLRGNIAASTYLYLY